MAVEQTLLPALDEIRAAQRRIAGLALRTPLVRAQVGDGREIFLKLENLQSVGSFKIRCGANALLKRNFGANERATTASAGNFAQGLAFAGRTLGIPITAFVPPTAANSKIEALRRLDAEVVPVPYDQWWAMLARPSSDPHFIHPFADRDVLAGNGTIALELLEDLPEVASVLTPWGGGGLTVGIAAALRAAGSKARVIACETEAGAPLAAALAAGRSVDIDFNSKTFITGMGGPKVHPGIFPLARDFVAGTIEVTLAQSAAALRTLVENHHVVVEGAGAVPLAAALASDLRQPIVCILSGGFLDTNHLIEILRGDLPQSLG